MKPIVFYHNHSGNRTGIEAAKAIEQYIGNDVEYIDIATIASISDFLKEKETNQTYYLCGGDGTINVFVNQVTDEEIPENLYYYPTGTGNDFYADISNSSQEKKPVLVTGYLKNLPVALIEGKKYKFVNGVGYGIDGYCCLEGDRQRALSTKPVNYTGIAIKGLLGSFKPANGKITVDGVTKTYKKVWLAPVMNGKYYGGGMIPTPGQDRNNSEKTFSILVWHGSGALKTLINFPKIFKGEHIAKKKMCTMVSGKHIVVEFDKPIPAQVDGEVIPNVTKVEAFAFGTEV